MVFNLLALEKYMPGREVSGKEFFESNMQCEKNYWQKNLQYVAQNPAPRGSFFTT
jgi:hypothetical protein